MPLHLSEIGLTFQYPGDGDMDGVICFCTMLTSWEVSGGSRVGMEKDSSRLTHGRKQLAGLDTFPLGLHDGE